MNNRKRPQQCRREATRQRAYNKRASTCPIHGCQLVRGKYLWKCPTLGCDVRRGPGKTSLPCDRQTADAREACHRAFDALWREGRFSSRNRAYRWLSQAMGLHQRDCHFGMFDLHQCELALDAIANLLKKG